MQSYPFGRFNCWLKYFTMQDIQFRPSNFGTYSILQNVIAQIVSWPMADSPWDQLGFKEYKLLMVKRPVVCLRTVSSIALKHSCPVKEGMHTHLSSRDAISVGRTEIIGPGFNSQSPKGLLGWIPPPPPFMCNTLKEYLSYKFYNMDLFQVGAREGKQVVPRRSSPGGAVQFCMSYYSTYPPGRIQSETDRTMPNLPFGYDVLGEIRGLWAVVIFVWWWRQRNAQKKSGTCPLSSCQHMIRAKTEVVLSFLLSGWY